MQTLPASHQHLARELIDLLPLFDADCGATYETISIYRWHLAQVMGVAEGTDRHEAAWERIITVVDKALADHDDSGPTDPGVPDILAQTDMPLLLWRVTTIDADGRPLEQQIVQARTIQEATRVASRPPGVTYWHVAGLDAGAV